jgi:hypothetical protein
MSRNIYGETGRRGTALCKPNTLPLEGSQQTLVENLPLKDRYMLDLISLARGVAGVVDPLFGTITYTSSAPRQGPFGAKVTFQVTFARCHDERQRKGVTDATITRVRWCEHGAPVQSWNVWKPDYPGKAHCSSLHFATLRSG